MTKAWWRIALAILTVSMLTDFSIAAVGALSASMAQAKGLAVSWPAIGISLATGSLAMLRTLQAELKAVGIKLSDVLRQMIKDAGGAVPPPGTGVEP
jgi:hypothetical protein